MSSSFFIYFIYYLLFIVYYLLFIIYCLLFIIYYLLDFPQLTTMWAPPTSLGGVLYFSFYHHNISLLLSLFSDGRVTIKKMEVILWLNLMILTLFIISFG